MLSELHLLLTYRCTLECDHCFLYSGPAAEGTMTLSQIKNIFTEAKKTGSIEWIYFEGGEPFLLYPLLVKSVALAKVMGFKTGIVTNAYWAEPGEDVYLWLKPLADVGLDELCVSDDTFHSGGGKESPAKKVLKAAEHLGIPASSICIEKPFVEAGPGEGQEKGRPVTGGAAMFKGRAVEKLINGLPRRNYSELAECPFEELISPSRVHIDSYGNVHLCQGISMGNMYKTPLSDLIREYDAELHPVAGPLIKGGPALLAETYNLEHEDTYVDECHFCFSLRRSLLEKFPGYLTPKQVYGLKENKVS